MAVVLAVGGVVSVIVKRLERYHADRVKAEDLERAERSEWGGLLAQVVGVDEALASARQLMLTHRTAKAYGHHYRILLDTRLTLQRVINDPRVEAPGQKELTNTSAECWRT